MMKGIIEARQLSTGYGKKIVLKAVSYTHLMVIQILIVACLKEN